MDMNQVKRVYFIGIGGIGMSALARYFKKQNCIVSGYDKTETEITDALINEGIDIHFEDNIALADTDADLIVYTPAVPASHTELVYFKANGYQVLKRSQVLGLITQDKFVIAVAGSHGKTTVSGMIAWLLKYSGYDCTAILGGISTNFNSNYITGFNDVFVVEADEYDRSFMQLHPNIAIITATDSDHLEVYGTQEAIEEAFLAFAQQIKPRGLLISKPKLGVFQKYPAAKKGYDLSDAHADLYATSYAYDGACTFALNNGMQFRMLYPGVHNIENAIAAISVCLHLNINPDLIYNGLIAYSGIHRRFELVSSIEGKVVFYDDYAHHPEEIRMFLSSIKLLYPGSKVTAIFQPHLFTRTRDLADGFAASLDLADETILLPIYPAREEPIPGVTASVILDKMTNASHRILEKNALLDYIRQGEFEVICTIGAGDIDKLVKPIAQILKDKG